MYSYENYSKVKESIEKRRLEAIKIADEKTMRLHIESEELREGYGRAALETSPKFSADTMASRYAEVYAQK